ncbi:hypothetical protein C4K19_0373 [Pseudomonas chlororaphis subsp. aurantiaca]|uniref:hypothetical protein n=1 Tax=Pseudomonas chlororaphis TaxID=587753 RepID=UPI000F5674F5|nr:hypothetical protein [Pseudomonas chlororaphis]AZD52191.1 hypothetical protein C4K19_0373 [Pseudomonas chlororaphis subsp. aurantiaca]
MSCKAFFETLSNEREAVSMRATVIDTAFPDAYCETESVSRYSSGLVQSTEYLHRYVFSPIHMNGEKVKAALFSDCKDKGLSCERSPTSEVPADIHARGKALVDGWNAANPDSDSPRSYVGVVSAQCERIRELVAQNQRMMAVYDTALADNPLHVDVFQIVNRKRSDVKQARKDIADLFSQIPSSN